MKLKIYLATAVVSAGMLSASWQSMAATFNVVAGDSASFQQALDAAAALNEPNVIVLPAGTYLTANNMGQEFFYDSALGQSLTIQGAGAGQTIVDGGTATRGLQIQDTSAAPQAIDHVIVQDITIQNGKALEGIFFTPLGAGLLINSDILVDNIEIKNCEFINNVVLGVMQPLGGGGGGVFIDSLFSHLSLANNVFQENQANVGGGISMISPQDPIVGVNDIQMRENQFLNNRAVTAGGANLSSLTAALERNNFEGNTAEDSVGGLSISAMVEARLNDNRFVGNRAIEGSVGGLWVSFSDKAVVTNGIIVNNQSGGSSGGFQYGFRGVGLVDPDEFDFKAWAEQQLPEGFDLKAADVAAGEGLTLTNNTISGNQAVDFGGGVGIFAYYTFFQNPAELEPSRIDIYNNIIYGNSVVSGVGGDIYMNDFINLDEDVVAVPVNLFNNDFSSFVHTCETNPGCGDNLSQGNNIDANPLFVDLANADVHLTAGSPAIDVGDNNAPGMPSLDYDDVTRPFGSAPDMGAFEAVPDIETPPILDFGVVSVGDSPVVSLKITNLGVGVLDVGSIDLRQANTDFSLDFNGDSPNPCGNPPFSLAGGGNNCTIAVIFAPQSSGSQSNFIDIASNDPDEPVVSVSLLGTTPNGGLLEGGGLHCSLNSASTFNGFAMLWMVAPMLLGMFRMTKRS